MPIYEYRCDNCGHEFETIRKVSEPPLTRCPACEKDALRKKVSAAGFRLKGGGWYETDFKSDGKRNVAGEEKASADGSKSGDKASGDAASSKSGEPAASKPADKSGGDSKGARGDSGSARGDSGSARGDSKSARGDSKSARGDSKSAGGDSKSGSSGTKAAD